MAAAVVALQAAQAAQEVVHTDIVDRLASAVGQAEKAFREAQRTLTASVL
jgi:hypothetical protein